MKNSWENTSIDTDHVPTEVPSTSSQRVFAFGAGDSPALATQISTDDVHAASVDTGSQPTPKKVVSEPAPDIRASKPPNQAPPPEGNAQTLPTQSAQDIPVAELIVPTTQEPKTQVFVPRTQPKSTAAPVKFVDATSARMRSLFSGRIGRTPGSSLTSRLFHMLGGMGMSDYEQAPQKTAPVPAPAVPATDAAQSAKGDEKKKEEPKKSDSK